jgi:hypothetical protein
VSKTKAKINFPDINNNYTLIDFKNFDSKCEKILSDDLFQYFCDNDSKCEEILPDDLFQYFCDNEYEVPTPNYGISFKAKPGTSLVEAPPWFVNIVSYTLQEAYLEHLFNQNQKPSPVKSLKKFGIWSETELNKSSEISSDQIRKDTKREPFKQYTDENGEVWQSFRLVNF